jgi:site-specific DNA recombinase
MSSKAVLYCRVSTEDQSESGTSLAAQFAACQKTALDLGCAVIAHIEDVTSGGFYLARPKMQAALELIESKQADTLIIYKLDRTGRDVDALRDIRKRVSRAGGQLVFADGMQFEKTPVGNLMFTQLGAFAEFERELIRERTSNGSRRRAASGIMPVRARRPFGYRFVTVADVASGAADKSEVGQYRIDESEAVWIRRLFEEYAAGRSLDGLARLLHDNSVATHNGGSQWRATTLRNILRNSLYKGKAAYGKRQALTDESRMEQGYSAKYTRERPPEEWLYFDAPAIVAPELWQTCQEQLSQNRKRYSGKAAHRRLLSGLVRCRGCGRTCTYTSSRFRYVRKTDRPYTVKQAQRAIGYYRCNKRFEPQPCPFAGKNHSAARLHAIVSNVITELLSDATLLRDALNRFMQQQANQSPARVRSERNRLDSERRHTLPRPPAANRSRPGARECPPGYHRRRPRARR